ncbi:MAG TPA: NAD(P)-dependent oxidoreductase [Candidatus Paceibacterota bacterium]
MNILVTGGAGYVGYSAVKMLARKYPQSKIIIHDNLSKSKLENVTPLLNLFPNVEMTAWESADIRDYEKFEKVLVEYKPDVVIHLAAIVDAFSTNREGKDIECTIVNQTAAIKIAEVCKKHGVKTFIYQSTVSMYSRGEDLKEDAPKEPLSTYGISKYEAEKAILQLDDENFNTCALRSATLVGYNPAFRYETIINMLCIRSIYGITTTLFESALKNPKTYLALNDEAAAIIFAMENISKMKGQAYNLTSFNTNLEDVVEEIEKNGLKARVKINKENTINQQVYTINSDKIKSIGFSPKVSLEEVIKGTLTGLQERKKENDAHFYPEGRVLNRLFRLVLTPLKSLMK